MKAREKQIQSKARGEIERARGRFIMICGGSLRASLMAKRRGRTVG